MKHGVLVLWLLLVPGVGFLALFFGLPLALALLSSLGIGTIGAESGFTLHHYVDLFADSVYRDGLLFSIYISVVPTLVSLAIAVPLAVSLQASFPGKKIFSTLYKAPLVIPSIVAAFIVMILFDRGGEISRMLKPLGLGLPKLVRDEWALGVIIAMAWKAIPFMTLIIAGAVATIPEDLRAAARTLGAGRLITLWRIELPLALPGITAATLLVFVTSTGAFAVPSLLGPIYPKPLSVWMYDLALREQRLGHGLGDGHRLVGGRLHHPGPLLPPDHAHAPRLRGRCADRVAAAEQSLAAAPPRAGRRRTADAAWLSVGLYSALAVTLVAPLARCLPMVDDRPEGRLVRARHPAALAVAHPLAGGVRRPWPGKKPLHQPVHFDRGDDAVRRAGATHRLCPRQDPFQGQAGGRDVHPGAADRPRA